MQFEGQSAEYTALGVLAELARVRHQTVKEIAGCGSNRTVTEYNGDREILTEDILDKLGLTQDTQESLIELNQSYNFMSIAALLEDQMPTGNPAKSAGG